MRVRSVICSIGVGAALVVSLACGGGDDGSGATPTLPPLPFLTPTVSSPPTPPPASGESKPTGKITFVRSEDGDREIYITNVDGSGLRNLTDNPADDFDQDVSADGSRIVFVSDRNGGNHLFVMDADGSDVKQLTLGPVGGLNPRWSNDGTKIVYTRGVDLAVIDASGGDPEVIMETQPGDTADVCRAPAFPGGWSPDDSRITYYSVNASNQVGQVCTIAADGSEIEALVSEPPALHIEPAWSADGRYIAYRSVRGGIHDVWMLDLETGENFNLTSSTDIDLEPAWSPDGEWLALAVLVPGEPQSDIYIMRRDGSDLRRLTDDPGGESYPRWSP